ncbi:hypothetical protein GGC63_003605 [Paenibacillus sp. OAS669]|nr:hypothetical protein [Paenibacillus sp. OAS669]
MPRRSLRPPLKSVKIPLNIIPFHGFQQRLEGHTPLEYIGNASSNIGFPTDSSRNRGSLFASI